MEDDTTEPPQQEPKKKKDRKECILTVLRVAMLLAQLVRLWIFFDNSCR